MKWERTVRVASWSDGRVPEHRCLRRVGRRTDLFGPVVFGPAREGRQTVLLALVLILVPVLGPVGRRGPFQQFLKLRMLPGANFHAEGAFSLNLFKHGRVSTHPRHLGHLMDKKRHVTKAERTLTLTLT